MPCAVHFNQRLRIARKDTAGELGVEILDRGIVVRQARGMAGSWYAVTIDMRGEVKEYMDDVTGRRSADCMS